MGTWEKINESWWIQSVHIGPHYEQINAPYISVLGHYRSTNVSQDCALLLVSFNFKNMFSSKV